MKKIGYLFLFILTMGLASCGEEVTTEELELPEPKLSIGYGSEVHFWVYSTQTFNAYWNFNAKEDKVTWSISNDGIEIINKKDNWITAKMVKKGTTVVTARLDGYEAQCTVTIN